MSTLTFAHHQSVSRVVCQITNAVFATLRGQSTGTSVSTAILALVNSDGVTNTWNAIGRGRGAFYPTGIGSVSAATLKLKAVSSVNPFSTNPTLDIVQVTCTYPDLGVVVADYGAFTTTLLSDTRQSKASWVTGTWYDFPLNAAGLALIANNTWVTLGVRLSWDTDNAPPTWVINSSCGMVIDDAVLEVVTDTGTTLAVRTDPATNISSSNAQLNGTLLDDGV